MRKVTLNIASLSLVAGDTITLKLINSVGSPCYSRSGYTIDQSFVLAADVFEVELKETDLVGIVSSYQLTLPSGLKFNFTVPPSLENIPHELLSLTRLACYADIINQNTKQLDSEFIKQLDLYFTGENPRFSSVQRDLVELYEYYADTVHATPSTIDIMQMMDEYLATLGV
ncbi:MAG: hypothetical protein IBX43_05025 [Campylobacterales bacterium]|nr:hypothetical protein [Campylobacterales bacterium]